jgi:hypothetical protein
MTQVVIGKQATAASFEAGEEPNAYLYIGVATYTKLPPTTRVNKN